MRDYSRYNLNVSFAKEFQRSYRFYWPFPFQNAFTYDPDSRSYELNFLFEQFCRDLRSWGVDRSFVDSFPEFADGFHTLAFWSQS